MPRWTGKLYFGDSHRSALVSDDMPEIPSSAPEFDDVVAMSRQDFRSFYKTYVLGCREWKTKPPVSVETQP